MKSGSWSSWIKKVGHMHHTPQVSFLSIVRLLKAQNGPNAEINGRKQNMVSLEAEFIVE